MRSIKGQLLELLPRDAFLYRVCRHYVDRYNSENHDDIHTKGELRLMQTILPQSATVFDVGANVGDWRALALDISPRLQISCFEPRVATFQRFHCAGTDSNWDLWLRCQGQARKVAFVAESLVQVRSHGGQIGATGAKANSDIDVLYKMLEKRWKEHPVLSELGRQGQYLRLRLGVSCVYRGLCQVMRHKMGGSISRWDAFQRLYRHLGAMNLFVLITWALIYLPFYPYLNKRITNLQRVRVTGLFQPRSETPTNSGKS